jgi:outer membrane protein
MIFKYFFMKRAYALLFMISWLPSGAQTFNLQQCIDTALANNIQVKQNGLLVDAAVVNWQQSRSNLLPNLNATFNHGINQGRSIDPFTNSYVNQSVNYAGYGLNSGVVLFNGMNLQNSVKQNASTIEATRMELQQARDNLTLNVILAYLQVLNNEDVLISSEKQVDVSKQQVQRLEILDSKGAISPSQLSDVTGQLMNDQLGVTTALSQLETSKLQLAQLMNLPYSTSIKLDRIDVDRLLDKYSRNVSAIYSSALEQFALVKAVQLRKKSAAYALKAAKGELYPTLSLGGSVQTNYSSAAEINNGKISYNEQLSNNLFSGLNLGLHIPLFNGKLVRNRIKIAGLELKNEELVEENTRVQLRQQVEQAYLNMTNAYERYELLQQQVQAYEQSFKAAEARFNAGVGNSVDFLIAKNNVDRATQNYISSKYEFVLRKRILDYYNGK